MKIVKGILYFLASILIPIIILSGIFTIGALDLSKSPKNGDPSPYLISMGTVIMASSVYLGLIYFKMKETEPLEALGFLAGFIFWMSLSLLIFYSLVTI